MKRQGDASGAVQSERVGAIGYLTLCSGATLNALTPAMVDSLASGLNQHETDAAVSLIIIRSDNQRAFCAGGDVKHIRQLSLAGEHKEIGRFFKHEYALNLAIAACEKPYLALINGVAMGGGLGISVHGRFRVVTERAILAMPESRIGFFPDVGASCFLPLLPHRSGWWLGMTAAHVKGSQAVLSGLATHYVHSNELARLVLNLEEIAKNYRGENKKIFEKVDECLSELSSPVADEVFSDLLIQRAEWFSGNNLETIRSRLENTSSSNEDAMLMLSLIREASPYSIAVTLDLLQLSAQSYSQIVGNDAMTHGSNLHQSLLSLCLENEYRYALEASRHPDFIEGVEAILIDKKRAAVWQ